MYYIIEYNTDMRCPSSKYHRFSSLKAATNFKKKFETKLAFPGAADPKLPMTQQNYHHRVLSSIYEMPFGFSLKREAKKLVPKQYIPQGMYPTEYETSAIYKHGMEAD